MAILSPSPKAQLIHRDYGWDPVSGFFSSFSPCSSKRHWCLTLTCYHRKTLLGTVQEWRGLHSNLNASPACGSGPRIIRRTENTEAMPGVLGLKAVKAR